MAFTFPTSPSNGDTFNINNDYYIRVGGKWTSAGLRIGTVPTDSSVLANLAAYANMPATLPAFNGNTSFHARDPYVSPHSAGAATSATDGWWEARVDQPSVSNNVGLLLPLDIYTLCGSNFGTFGNINAEHCNALIDGTYYKASFGSTSPGSFSAQFGSNGDQPILNQLGTSQSAITPTDYTELELRVPAGNTHAGTVIRIKREDTVISTQAITGISGTDTTNNYYNFRWQHFPDETFVTAAT